MAQEKISLAVMGMDQHENGVIAVGRILREAQMSTAYLGKLLSPGQVVDGALSHGADVIGISCHSWEYLTLVPQLVEELRSRNLNIPVMIGGSVVTADDAVKMKNLGVAAVFGAGARDDEIVDAVRSLARKT
ncbi:cobalamin B12-binding domain-containing protein [Novosphingobium sp. B1]|uniref:cobalamin B12-binding domain-containing protein n=1 Tax=Novosphingobium sp. B1 TaxID=1938756 RepID=UPI0009D7E8E5|nr:cobalamin-dependent protein [Novosphingobium sp. B1]SMC77805.1 methylmalonyl-CoA mutase, C-terminal domain [Novosphingobium sp. B1]